MTLSFRHSVREFFTRRFFAVAFVSALALGLLSVALILWKLYPDVRNWQVVALHYNIHFGIDRTGSWWRLFVPAGSSLLITVINAFWAARLLAREVVLAYAFVLASVVVSVLVFISTVLIVSYNLLYA